VKSVAHSEKFEELAALQALGLPLGEESSEFARHLEEGCPACEELLADFRFSASALSAGVPARRPRPELREQILKSLAGPRFQAVSTPARSSGAALWLAAAAALLLAVVVWDDARLRRQREDLRSQTAQLSAELTSARSEAARRDLRARVLESDDVRVLLLGGKYPQPSARGKVFWSEKAKTGMLVAANLAPLPSDKQYELWVFAESKPVAAGVFDADASGRAVFESKSLSDLRAAQNFAVTVEPRGGVPQPTGPIVLVGTPSA
jgi:anti-sigma-K factor RskA